MLRFTKLNSNKYILILLILVGCNSTRKNSDVLSIDNKDFSASFSKPFTNDLQHYQHGLEQWKNPNYEGGASHFPDTLYSSIGYEFFYVPRILQGQSSIKLKLKFDDLKLAEKFYEKTTNREIQKEFFNFEELEKSLYCYPKEFGFPSGYNLNNNCEIKLFKAPKCGGQGGEVLGGIASGIAIDKSLSIVVCWASDLTL